MTKAHAAPRTKKSRSSTPEYRADGAKHEPKGACKLRNLPIHSIPQAVCDAAVAYFMTSYIVATPFEAYLPGFFISECFHDNPCTLAVSATALATFARRVRCDTYLETARRNYSLEIGRAHV